MSTDAPATVVVLTALDLEYQAVRAHLTGLRTRSHPAGTLFEVGRLAAADGGAGVDIALAVTGEGGPGAAVLTERAIATFRPRALLFSGVAGGLKNDIELGDVVVATKIYAYHGGKDEDDGFHARPRAWEAPHELDQLARHLARTGAWTDRLPPGRRPPPQVHFKPIAAGDVVLNSRNTPLAEQLRRTYNDAAAIEMESAGVSHAGHLNRSLPVLTVRGISDKADGLKRPTEDATWQPVAAAHAAAFAVALVTRLTGPRPEGAEGAERDTEAEADAVNAAAAPAAPAARVAAPTPPAPPPASDTQHVIAQGGAAFGVLKGDMHLHQGVPVPAPPRRTWSLGPAWAPLADPVHPLWQPGLTEPEIEEEGPVLGLHLVPVDEAQRFDPRARGTLMNQLH
ncbi:5'-methylthioadenosine/S-adenosylhomocysteine nucleosidase [Streptomyces sp. SAJ15]|uniref:5'-methylthioadenosine/S-adenosylhomocysteine nucleosidase family protein n=1 Tax=Streptomyces sp. SAJ15 TaxID=2011095 RepID=UPI00135F0A50|nr:5'-methylthioadenosine/S-adenosylhomocysteine nucleosidase [Streptomyces sp. SAJ15]TVL89281.1 purine phosphorylase [Streptomyces sp. SAJ15]